MIDQFLWRKAMMHRLLLIASVVCGVLTASIVLLQSYILADIVYRVFWQEALLTELWQSLWILLVLMTLRAVLSYIEQRLSLALAWRVQESLRKALLDKIARLGPVKMNQTLSGKVVNLLTEGIAQLENYFSDYLPQLLKATLIPALFLLFIFPLDWISGVILLVTAPLIPFFMMLIGKWTENVSRRQWRVLSLLSGYLADVLSGLRALKLLNRSQKQGEKIAQVSEEFRLVTLSVMRWAFISSLALELLTTLSIAVVSVGLGLRLVEGLLDFRIAFFLLLLAPEFYAPLRALGGFFHTSLNGVAAAKDIAEFLLLSEDVHLSPSVKAADLTIELQNVAYRYHNGAPVALADINLRFEAGEKIGVVGPSGSGKSTLLNLLAGFIAPSQGQLLIGGVDSSQLDWSTLRQQTTIISQNPYLFSATLAENVLFDTSCTENEIQEIIEKLGLTSLLAQLPQGLATKVGQGGRELSGGQRQLVMMVRAFLQNPSLILMDEATANLDVLTEQQIQQVLPSFLAHKGAVIVAHRLSTIKQMDRIIVLDQGKIVASGTHEQLLVQSSLYQQLIREAQN